MNRIIKFLNLAIATMLLGGMLGCATPPFKDITNVMRAQRLLVPKGEFESVTWLEKNSIAFVYRPDEVATDDTNVNFSIGIFDIATNTNKDLSYINSTLDCYEKQGRISYLSRLPDSSLGFIFQCESRGDSLYSLNLKLNELLKQQTYLGFTARSFSFSPDMSKIIQENGNGSGLSEKLLLVFSDGTINQLISNFQRARSPAWSADGNTIAFAGTKDNPLSAENNSLRDIESLFFYPWDIYLMNSDGSNPRVLLPSVGTIYGLKWCPTNENILLFGGNSFGNVPGVWLLDISDMSIKRIWDKNTKFDWSPDGTKIVLLDNNTGSLWSGVTIIDVTEP